MTKVQTGVIAFRDEKGNFLPAKPIYEDIPDTEAKTCGSALCSEFAKLFIDIFKQNAAINRAVAKER